MHFTKMHGLGNDYLYVYGDAPIAVHLDGGTLVIRITSDNTVTMTGSAEIVYEGETKLC